MKNLYKKFHTSQRTIEAMMSICGGFTGTCACDQGADCACPTDKPNQQYSQYRTLTDQTDFAYKKAPN